MLYIDYCKDGVWVIGDRFVDGLIAFPRLTTSACCRRLVSFARDKYFGARLVISEAAIYAMQCETWRWEGWEDPAVMLDYIHNHLLTIDEVSQ